MKERGMTMAARKMCENSMKENHWVECYDGSYPVSAQCIVYSDLNWGTAKAIARHFNKKIAKQEEAAGCVIPVSYYACRNFEEGEDVKSRIDEEMAWVS